jgi:hypothetical protein
VLPRRGWVVVPVLVVAGCAAGPDRSSSPVPAPAVPHTVLRDWDTARAGAWADGDPAALSALYLPGSAAGLRDVRLLRSYAARGLRVSDLRMQRLAVRVLVEDGTRLRLEVVERLLGAQVRHGAAVRRLPTGQPVRRVIELRLVDGVWKVARVATR